MPTLTTVDISWTPAPTTYDDAEARRFDTTAFLGDGSPNGVRSGIVRHGDNSLAVSVDGSDRVTVQPGAFVIAAATGLGVYRGALQTATTATALAARNGTNPRIDLIVIQATSTGAVVKTIEGSAAASPSPPALPAQHIEVARANVPAVGAGAVTVDSSWRVYAAGLGGTLVAETATRFSNSGNQKGQRAVALDTGIPQRWDGTAWSADGLLHTANGQLLDAAGSAASNPVGLKLLTSKVGLTFTSGIATVTFPGGGFANGVLGFQATTLTGAAQNPVIDSGGITKTTARLAIPGVSGAVTVSYFAFGW